MGVDAKILIETFDQTHGWIYQTPYTDELTFTVKYWPTKIPYILHVKASFTDVYQYTRYLFVFQNKDIG